MVKLVRITRIEEIPFDDYMFDIEVPRNQTFFGGEKPRLLHNSDWVDYTTTFYKALFAGRTFGDCVEAYKYKATQYIELYKSKIGEWPNADWYCCYDPETEVLTLHGWKRIGEVTYEDYLATRTIEDPTIQYQKPINLFKYPYNGKMLQIKNRRVDLLVTPNHKLLILNEDGSLSIRIAEEIKSHGLTTFTSKCKWQGEETQFFILPELNFEYISGEYKNKHLIKYKEKKIPMDLWMNFLGWYISEGSVGYNGNKNSVVICQNPGKYFEEIKNILKELVKYLEHPYVKKWNYLQFSNKQLNNYLRNLGRSKVRYIPPIFKNLSIKYLRILFESLMKGDGTYRGNGAYQYYTVSKKLADDVQEISLKLGYNAIVGFSRRENRSSGWTVHINPRTYSMATRENKKLIDYQGYVYCCEVPNHIILIRRNGRPIWCCNSSATKNRDGFKLIGNPFDKLEPPLKAEAPALALGDLRDVLLGFSATAALMIATTVAPIAYKELRERKII
ncbi:MAG: hypothetical protein K6T73_03325 [Candidatus Bathyarchaeota archaeon]|nr:hypothetical protein [Candidatus Bathyarchaeota archaeon]